MKEIKEKKCSDCNLVKPVNKFWKNPKMKDGYLKRCQDCERKRLAMKEDSPEYAKHFFTHDRFYI